ncbi:hypothetical protein BC834DRAFT_846164 [Gloeopeniophorella convolvens]|nr:hypothetical protein BC834DRAFT_846164 [Gloeopeniophorella convolvens]
MQTTPSGFQPADVSKDIMGYGFIAKTYHVSVAERYFAQLLRAPPTTPPMRYYGVTYKKGGWYVTTNMESLPALSLAHDPKSGANAYTQRALDHSIGLGPQGTIVRQRLFEPTDPLQHAQDVANAPLKFPVYFYGPDHSSGSNITSILGKTERDNHLRLGGSAGTNLDKRRSIHIHIAWPGYSDWTTRVDVAIMLESKVNSGWEAVGNSLLYQTARAVDQFLQLSCGLTPERGQEMWAIGPNAITRDEVNVVGIVNIGLDRWQPIIQLSRGEERSTIQGEVCSLPRT